LQNALDAKFDDPTGTTSQYIRGDGSLATFPTIPSGTVTSVGLTMPSAFSVANSPITSSGTLAVTGAGTSAQYVRGDGQLANFPSNGGGGSSVNYYLNGSVNQGTFGGDTYYEMSKTPVLGAGTNFTRTNGQGNGYIASFITDAGDPSLLNIPGGNWNLEFYFQSSASGGNPQFYGEVYKVDASNNFTLVASGSTNPEGITNGTTVDQYFTSIPVPQTSLLVTDRLAIRIYVITSGRTITLHTEDGNLCEVLTTFSTGLNALNGLTAQVQYFATGTSGTDFAISSATDTHTFNLPTASATNRGALSSADWSTFNNKQNTITNPVTGTGTTNYLPKWTSGSAIGNSLVFDNGTYVGIGTTSPYARLSIEGGSNTPTSFGNLLVKNSSETGISFGASSTSYAWIQGNIYGSTYNLNLVLNAQGGNLLVGTTTDNGSRFQVSGAATFSSSVTTSSHIIVNNGAISFGGSGFVPSTDPAIYRIGGINDLAFAIGSAERMRLTSNGNLLVGTTTDVASSKVTISSTTQGFLPPRMTNAQRTAISSPAVGLIVYCTDATEGLYQYINNAWVNLTGVVTNRQTASYTLALGDSNDLVEMNVATANNLTVPLNSSVAFPIGTKIDVAQYGAGQTTVVATSGVTVRSSGGALKLAVQYSGATLVKIATDEWYLFGDITV
jgi:hypothetical protein